MTRDQKALREAYRAVFAAPLAEIVLDDLRKAFDRDTHVPGDPYTSAYNAGARAAYLRITHLTEAEKPDA